MDDLLDYVNTMRRRVDLLRDSLSEALTVLPDGGQWRDAADLYVITDPSSTDLDDVALISMQWDALRSSGGQMLVLDEQPGHDCDSNPPTQEKLDASISTQTQ